MSMPVLTLEQLRQLGARPATKACPTCASLACPGWESVPGGFDTDQLRLTGTLRDSSIDDPTLQEYHPAGTSAWSPDAPIAPAFFPYNRCEVWQCRQCARAFLRYTEYGGYYVEQRIRDLDARLLVDVAL